MDFRRHRIRGKGLERYSYEKSMNLASYTQAGILSLAFFLTSIEIFRWYFNLSV